MSRLYIKKFFSKTNRNLFIELVRAKFKVSDHNSFFGMLWSLIGPFSLLLVMYFIFRQRFGQRIYAYPLYLLLGISCVNFFTTAISYIMRTLSLSRGLVLNSTIRREILLLSDFFVYAYKFMIELVVCYILSIFYTLFSWKGLLLFVPLFLAYVLFVLGTSLAFSVLYCFSRDLEHIWMLISRLLFFITPVFFRLNNLSLPFRKIIYWLNPLSPFVISFQNLYMGKGNIDVSVYLHSLTLGIFYFAVGYSVFVAFEDKGIERV